MLGEYTSLVDLLLIGVFTIASTVIVSLLSIDDFSILSLWQLLFILLMMIDIYGGVVANFSYGTNKQYSHSNKSRLVFIGIHVQPILLALVIGDYLVISLIVWAMTIGGALIVNQMRLHPSQRVIGGLVMMILLMVLLQFVNVLPLYLLTLYGAYIIKVAFSFAVDHFAVREVSHD